MKIGLLHPGAMGVTVAQTLQSSGHTLYWLPEHRSTASQARAAQLGLQSAASLSELCASVAAVVSVCPPEHALNVAEAVADRGFSGLYLDANAIAPMTAERIAALFAERYVDGGIIGPPALRANTTRLYLSGPMASSACNWFSAGPLAAVDLHSLQQNPKVTAASMLKMSYAAYTKGHSALLLNVCALAQAGQVEQALQYEWSLSQPQLGERAQRIASGTAPKAWRFVAEMQQIADTFADQNLPAQFHQGAADVYQRMRGLQHESEPDLALVLNTLTNKPGESS